MDRYRIESTAGKGQNNRQKLPRSRLGELTRGCASCRNFLDDADGLALQGFPWFQPCLGESNRT